MDARQLGQRMGGPGQVLGNGMGQWTMHGMGHWQPRRHQPQNGFHAQNGVRRPQGYGFVFTNQQQNTGLYPRQQQQHFPPQKPNASGPPISFHYPRAQDPLGTPLTRTASTGSIRPFPQQLSQTPPCGKKLSKTRNGPDRSSTMTLHTNDSGSIASVASSMEHKFAGRSPL